MNRPSAGVEPDPPRLVIRALRAVRALLSTRAAQQVVSVPVTTLRAFCHAACAATGYETPTPPGHTQREASWDADALLSLIVQSYHACQRPASESLVPQNHVFVVADLLCALDALVS